MFVGRIRGLGYDVVDMGLRSVEVGLQAALGAVGLLRTGAEAVLGGPQPEVPQTSDEERPPARPSPPPRRAPRTAPESPPEPPEPPEPDHVDEGITPVAEFAEPGAEDGAGPEIDVDEPWDGYDAMRAPEIQRALAEAAPAALGAVRLYESMHKGRRSVLDAVDRRLAQTQ